jgi:transcription elongation factor GreA
VAEDETFEVEQFMLTPAGHQALLNELHELQERYDAQMAELAEVQNHTGGDNMPEEAAYFEAITMKEHLQERIGHLTYILQHSEVPKEDPNPKHLDPGERVIVWDVNNKREQQFDLLSGPEVVVRGEIGKDVQDVSVDSPVGKALLGKQVGDVVEVEVPDGRVKYAIRRIEQITD